MSITKTIATASLIIALTTSASLAEKSGFYGQIFGGVNILQDLNFAGNITTPGGTGPQAVNNDFDEGYNIGIAVGTYIPSWSNGKFATRAEIELSYSENDVNTINFSGNGPGAEANVAGDSSSTKLFANLLVDIKTANPRLTPYFGGGIGISFAKQDLVYGPGIRISESDEVFAAQLIVGTAYKLTDTLDLTLDGRYSRAFNVSSNRFSPTGVSTGVVEDDVDNLSINIGLRMNF